MNQDIESGRDETETMRRRRQRIGKFLSNALLFVIVIALLAAVNALTSPGRWWVVWPALGLGFALLSMGWRLFVTPRFAGESFRRRGGRF